MENLKESKRSRKEIDNYLKLLADAGSITLTQAAKKRIYKTK